MFMKWIKKTFLFIAVLVLLVSLLLKKEKNIILLLGDNKEIAPYLQELAKGYTIDSSLSLKSMKSKELLYYVTSNAYLNKDKEKVSIKNLIKESDYIILSIGLNDVLNKITVNKYEESINYDIDSINLSLSLFEQNLYNMIEHILLINESIKIIIQTYSDPFIYIDSKNDVHLIMDNLNSSIISISNVFEQYYIEVETNNTKYYNDKFSFYPNNLGNQKIAENIYQKIIAIS